MGKFKVKPRSKKNALEETKAKKKAEALKSVPPVWPTKSGFKKWLESRSDRIVGYTCDSTDCALARYTKTLNPKKSVVVGLFSGMSIGKDYRPHPSWVKKFLGTFDAINAKTVKGKDALRCL